MTPCIGSGGRGRSSAGEKTPWRSRVYIQGYAVSTPYFGWIWRCLVIVSLLFPPFPGSKSDPASHLEGPNLLRNITLRYYTILRKMPHDFYKKKKNRPPPLNTASDLKHHHTNIVEHHHGHHKHQHHGPKMMMSMAKKLMKRVMRFAKAFEPFNLFHNHG